MSIVDAEAQPVVAVMSDVPALTPDARPPVVIVAAPGVPETQVTLCVRSWTLPSLKVPVAVNCCVLSGEMAGLAGATVIFDRNTPVGGLILATKASRLPVVFEAGW